MTRPVSDPRFEATAWSWVDHLRGGGTTPWLEWLRDPAAASEPVPSRRPRLPGAAQLEVVRRMATRPGAADLREFPALADRTLDRAGPGRGMPHLSLLWPHDAAQKGHRVGAPPVDPAAVPAEELLRVGVGLLAELLLDLPPAADPAPPPRRRLFGRRFHLAGAPATTARVRTALAAAGHVEGGLSPEVLIFAEPLDVALAQIWSTRVQHGAPVRWVTFARRWARRDQLPPSADLTSIASYWAGRLGPERVHVVTGPDALATAARILRVRLPELQDGAAAADTRSLSPAAVDLVRRLNRVLNVRLPEGRRVGYLRRLVELLPEDPDPVLDVPEECRDWLDARARTVAHALGTGGYAVHGDLDRIAPRHEGAAHSRRLDVLDLVLDTSLRVAELEA